MADRLNLPREYTRAHNNIAEQLDRRRGDFSGAERRFQLALERMERLGIVQSVVWLLRSSPISRTFAAIGPKRSSNSARFDGILETTFGHYLETSGARHSRGIWRAARGDAAAARHLGGDARQRSSR